MIVSCGYAHHTRGVIPDRITAPVFLAASAAAPLFAGDDWPAHLAAALVTAVVLAAAALLTDAISLGVVKLLLVVAVVIGPAVWLVIAMAAVGSAARSAVRRRVDRDGELNPVPQIAGGVVIVTALAIIV